MKKIYKLLLVFFMLVFPIDQVLALNYKSYLDTPVSSTVVGDSLYIQGWVMSDDISNYLKILVDDEMVESNIVRYEREDVIKAITGYGGILRNPKPGFQGNILLEELELKDGIHRLEVQVYSSDNRVVKSMKTNFIINNKLAKMYIDSPNSGDVFGDNALVNGWVMSTNQNGIFRVLIDDMEVDSVVTRSKREDVIKAITGYGDGSVNKKPGFSILADTSEIDDGTHKLEVQYINSEEDVLVSSSRNIKIEKDKTKMYLDTPSSNVTDMIVNVSGWVMSTNKDIKLELYIDDKLIDVEFDRNEREDVIKTVSGYGDKEINQLPGFSTLVDLSGYVDGQHIIKIVTKNRHDEVIKEVKRVINLDKYKSNMYIDTPNNNSLINGTDLELSGWVMSNASDIKIGISIDNTEEIEIVDRIKRSDVLAAYSDKYSLSLNKSPGFSINLDMSRYLDGQHTIYIKVYDKVTNEVIDERMRNVVLDKYNSDMYIDNPVSNLEIKGVNLVVDGWMLTESDDYSIKLFVDDEELESELERVEREDVLSAFDDKYHFDSNALPGFKMEANLENYKDGKHLVSVRAYNNKTGEVLIKKERTINLKKYISKSSVDTPLKDVKVDGLKLDIEGWVMTTSPDNYLRFFIDEELVEANVERIVRDDVLNRYGDEYGRENQNSLPGYKTILDVSNISDGNHNLKVKVYDSKTLEELIVKETSFYLKKYDGKLNIDYPTKANYSVSSNLTIQGWELSESADSVVRVFIDDKEIEVSRYEREDVLGSYPNSYGGREKNSLPGFTKTIDLDNISAGEHVIYIKLYNSFGDLIDSTQKKIIVYDKLYFGIDVSKHQGTINWDEVSKNGIDFAIIRLGYGSNMESQDDIEFWNNVRGCVKHNIPYGVYLYSYATNLNGSSELGVDSASIDSEIAHTLRVLGNLSEKQRNLLKLPVFIDMEDDSTISLGKSVLTNMADHYCSNIEKNGYECGVYANKNWLTNYLDGSYLGNKYDIWLAHYTEDYNNLSNYTGSYQLWQYTSGGSMAGINSSGLDMNVSFKKYW